MQYSTISKVGNREINEDAVGYIQKGNIELYVVADGLGGHGHGEVASSTVLQAMREYVEKTEHEGVEETLTGAIQYAQDTLLKLQEKTGMKTEMKTTVVALCSDGQQMCWAHVGDSRLYGFYKNKVKVRTLDHSIPQMLVLSGEIREKKIRNHPQRNMLLRVLGIEWDRPKYDVSDIYVSGEYQSFLLCSDGFWELIQEKQMEKLLKKSETVDRWLLKMTEIVEETGRKKDMDNYTAIAIWV